MTEPTNGEPTNGEPTSAPHDEHDGTPDVSSTQRIPSPDTQAMPTSGAYSYPGRSTDQDAGQGAGQSTAQGITASAAATGVALSEDVSTHRSKRTGLMIGGLAAALVLGGGAIVASSVLSGGGARPADVLPGDSYAYVQLDIDPSAGQKIAAVRFLDKLPQVKDNLGTGDLRKNLWDTIAKRDDCVGALSYDADIAPWLGDRVGLSLRPGGTKDVPNMAVAVQVKDEGSAKDALNTLLACDSDSSSDVRMRDGYAIITPGGQADATMAAIDKSTLADSADFSGDMSALGEQGIASAWFDGEPALKDMANLGGSSLGGQQLPTGVKGRVAMALRFDPASIELAGIARGVDGIKASSTNGDELTSLPDDTVAAVQVSGADQLIDAAWPQLVGLADEQAAKQGQGDLIQRIEQQLDITLPDDLKVLFGTSLTMALPDQDFGGSVPTFGAKVVTSDVTRAKDLLTRIEDASGGQVMLNTKVDGNTLAVATTPDYADTLVSGGSLGDTDGFKAALGDVSHTNVGVYVDLDRLEKLYINAVPSDQRAFVEALKALGLTSSSTADGEQAFSMRLVGN
ncbi:MAG: DUF3352 domain-containing protein [Micrococcales bacterium]|nr:DUF3352 domain-containing protein [Micrococcales bacterium]